MDSSDLISTRGFSVGFNTVDGKIKMAEVIKFNTKSSRVFNDIDGELLLLYLAGSTKRTFLAKFPPLQNGELRRTSV